MKILLLEDDKILNTSISYFLMKKGHIVDSFFDGDSVIDVDLVYDLYILDINVPNIDGLKVLEYIVEYAINPNVMMISTNVDIDSIKQSYKKGCFDYIKKPFDIEELSCKVDFLFRNQNFIIDLGNNLQYDFEKKHLLKNQEEIKLTKKESLLFHLLVSKKNNLVTQEDIEYNVYDNQSTNNSNIRALVKRVRDKIGEDVIRTEIDRGYRIDI